MFPDKGSLICPPRALIFITHLAPLIFDCLRPSLNGSVYNVPPTLSFLQWIGSKLNLKSYSSTILHSKGTFYGWKLQKKGRVKVFEKSWPGQVGSGTFSGKMLKILLVSSAAAFSKSTIVLSLRVTLKWLKPHLAKVSKTTKLAPFYLPLFLQSFNYGSFTWTLRKA